MDNHSEIEAKFRADTVSLGDFLGFMAVHYGFKKYKVVSGTDVYHTRGEDVVRHRYDGEKALSTLTVKKRKSAESIADRHEVDLPLRDDVQVRDVKAFLKLTGWEPLFSIEKTSYIAHVQMGAHVACLALYDVWALNAPEHEQGSNRFLEVEIEKDSSCTPEEAERFLQQWIEEIRGEFNLGDPSNQSLFEIYSPKAEEKP